ncbi:unnamed protein product [Enterobius vermicularis]|uniref:TOG domain-containing protein n=1 Tax=Enterobius vermicularis TaxID=51028 RepID=A0A158QAC1_ENTVE|nr:unnamed protein product [Enterobius vermicularis]
MSLTNIFQTDAVSPGSSDSSDPTLPHDDTIIELLGSYEFDVRLQTINGLSAIARHDSQWFTKFLRKGELVKQLELLLNDERWEVQHQTLKFLLDALPTFGTNTDFCMSYLLASIVMKLSSSKLTVRRLTNNLLIVYLKSSPSIVTIIQKILVDFLHQAQVEPKIKVAVLNEIPNLFIAECGIKNWNILGDGLQKAFSTDPKLLQKIAEVQERLDAYLKRCNPRLSTSMSDRQVSAISLESSVRKTADSRVKEVVSADGRSTVVCSNSSCRRYRFRVIPEEIFNALQQTNDAAIKSSGLEKMRAIIKNVTADDIKKIVPHLHSYFVALSKVLQDSDDNIIINCLEVIKLSIQKFNGYLDDHCQQIIALVGKNFGTERALIRQLTMSICLELMRNTNVKVVMSGLCPYTDDKNSRVKEEVLNILTAGCLKFDASKLNLRAVADVIVPLLIDEQRRVRLAAFELFAVISSIDSNDSDDLLGLVRNLEAKKRTYGLTDAVARRVSRNVLPKIRFDGLIEYSTPFSLLSPSMLGSESRNHENADYNWIKRGNTVPCTAVTRRLSPLLLKRNLSDERNLSSWTASLGEAGWAHRVVVLIQQTLITATVIQPERELMKLAVMQKV